MIVELDLGRRAGEGDPEVLARAGVLAVLRGHHAVGGSDLVAGFLLECGDIKPGDRLAEGENGVAEVAGEASLGAGRDEGAAVTGSGGLNRESLRAPVCVRVVDQHRAA